MSHSRSDAPDDSARCSSASRPWSASSSVNPWVQQRLDLSPLPQGHGEFRPGSAIRTRIAARAAGGKQGRCEGAAMRAHEQQGSCSLSSRGVPDLSNRRCSAPAKVPTGSRASSAALLDLGTRRRGRNAFERLAEAVGWPMGGAGQQLVAGEHHGLVGEAERSPAGHAAQRPVETPQFARIQPDGGRGAV